MSHQAARGGGWAAMDVAEAVMLGEIVSRGSRRKDVIDRPREYAAAGVPWYLRIDFRNRVPALALFALEDGEYRPTVAAAAGRVFAIKDPFRVRDRPGRSRRGPAGQ